MDKSMDKTFKPIKSVYNSNFETIKSIMELYSIERFDLDCTYSKGAFWKGLPQPVYKSDIYPSNDKVICSSSENLPFDNESMGSIMFDPPFLITSMNTHKSNKDGSSIITKRFEGYSNYKELKSHYFNTLKELYRICKKDGYVVFKMMDTVSGGKNHFTHIMVITLLPDFLNIANICKARNLALNMSTSRRRTHQFQPRLLKFNQDTSSPQWWHFLPFGDKLVTKFFCPLTLHM